MSEWKWYCRLCGAEGTQPTMPDRDAEALDHLHQTGCGSHPRLGIELAGHLLHVWTY